MSLRDLLRFTILACIFATPFICLIVAETMFFPFITGKNFTFRILVEVMLGAWGLLMFLDTTYRPKFSWILAAAGTFLAVLTAADFLGENPYRSFWSNYERMEGLITQAHLFLYFVVAGSVITKEELWNWFWRTSLGVSLIVAIYSFTQLAGKSEMHGRVDATFGNSTYLAVYMLFHAFLAMLLYFRAGKQNSLRWLYPVIAAIDLIVLYYTGTRGTILGVIGGVFLALLLVAFFDKEHPKLKRYAIGGVVGVVALIGLFIAFKDSALIQSSPTLSRMAGISLSDKTTASRFMIWSMSLEGFKERPILGWGQDNFLYVFAKHYNPKMFNNEPWFDRSHNVFFDWLIAGGALGLLSYLSMFGAALYYLWFSRKHHFSVLDRSILTGMLAGYFVHNIFVFDNLTSYLLFFTVLAYLHSLSAEAPAPKKKEAHHKVKHEDELEAGDIAIAGAVILVLTVGLIYFVNIRNINANVALINSIRPEGVLVDDGHGGKKIGIEAVLDRGLFGSTEAREQLAQIAIQTLDPKVPEQFRKQFYELADQQFNEDLANDPNNPRMQSFAATFYARFSQYDKALEHFQKAIELSPGRQSTYIDLAMMYMGMGRYADAEGVAKTGFELEKTNFDAGTAYVITLIYQKKSDLADEVLAILGDSRFDTRVINAYGSTGDYKKVIELVNEKIAKGQATGRDYFGLAGALTQFGQTAEAIAAVEKAIAMDESLKDQGTQLIEQIKAESK